MSFYDENEDSITKKNGGNKLQGSNRKPVAVGRVEDFADPKAEPSVLDELIAREEKRMASNEQVSKPKISKATHSSEGPVEPLLIPQDEGVAEPDDAEALAGKAADRLRKTMGGKDVKSGELRRALHLNGQKTTHHSR